MKAEKITPILVLGLLSVYFMLSVIFPVSQIFFKGYNPYDIKRICQLSLVIIFALNLIINSHLRKNSIVIFSVMPKWIKFSLILLSCLLIASAINSPKPMWAFIELSLYFGLFLFFITIVSCYLIAPELTRQAILWLLVVIGFFYMIYFYGIYVNELVENKGQLLQYFPGFTNLRFFMHFQIWTLPLLLYQALTLQKKIIRFILYILLCFWWVLTIINGAKGVWLFYGLTMVCFTLTFCRPFLKILIHHCIIIAISCLLVYGLFYSVPNLLSFKQSQATVLDNTESLPFGQSNTQTTLLPQNNILKNNTFSINDSVNARIAMIKIAWRLALSHPILGIGPMHYAFYKNSFAANPHNYIMQWFAEFGFLSTIIIGIILSYLMYKVIKYCFLNNTTNKMFCLYLALSLFAGFGYGLVTSMVVSPLGQTMMVLIGALFAGEFLSNRPIIKGNLVNILIILISVMVIIILLSTILNQLPHLEQHEIQWLIQQKHNVMFNPRFWYQGWIT